MSGAPVVNQLERLDQELETILTSFDTSYAWNYGSLKQGLRELYEKAKREQWNGTTELPWDIDVDPESEIIPQAINPLRAYPPYQKLNDKERRRLRHAQIALQLSQFLHGEQGAMIVASQLVGAVPWIEGKLYASTQTMDEARHVEVFSRYLRDKLEQAILKDCPDCRLNGDKTDRLPNTSNISFEYIEGEAILLMLDRHGICASSGSACTSGSLEPSHVLRAMGVPFTAAHGSIRFSPSRYNTEDEIDYAIEKIPPIKPT